MREWFARLIDSFRRDSLERELREELRFHQQQIERELGDDGSSAADAAGRARKRLGRTTRIVEETRDRWSVPWIDHLRQDLRHALRGCRRAPAFTATAVLTLGVGIGANAAVFDVIDRLMFRPLPMLREPGAVHRIYTQSMLRGQLDTTTWSSFQRFQDLKTWTTSFDELAVFNDRNMIVGAGEAARERRISGVTASFFDFFDAQPVLGRFFTSAEDTPPRGADVVVLSHAMWKADFGGANVIGRTIQVGSINGTVIGVAPEGFAGASDTQPPVLFVPLTTLGPVMGGPAASRFSSGYNSFWGNVIVRRKPGVTVEAASTDVTQAFQRSWEEERRQAPDRLLPAADAKPRAIVSSIRLGGGPDPSLEARTAKWVGGVAVLVLLIACANVTNLLLSRSLVRQRETAVRLALGVSRERLLSQALVESVTLAVFASAAGLLLAYASRTAVFGLLAPPGAMGTPDFLDTRTAVVTMTIALAVGLLTGIAPGVLAGRGGLSTSLKGVARGGSPRTHGRTALVVVQAALSVLLLAGAVLFVRSFSAVRAMPLGYEPDRVLVVNRMSRGPMASPDVRTAHRQHLLETAQSLPGVEYAAWRSSTPLGTTGQARFFLPGQKPVTNLGLFTTQETTADYFKVMGTRIVAGRGLTPEDRAGTPLVVVVSEAMAAALWPGIDAIGQCMHFNRPNAPCTTVVGIAENVVAVSPTAPERYQHYRPIDQLPNFDGFGLLLRMRGDPAAEAETVRRELQRVMTGGSYVTVQPMSELVDRAHHSWRLGATMFVAFGGLAVLLSMVGMYGVVGQAVSQRMHELSVRVALGARRRDILQIALAPSLRFALFGAVLGTLLAIAAAGRVQPLLFQQQATDPRVYVGVSLLMLVIAVVASALPAARAARADPNAALRAE
jgi:predicted permease